MVSKLIGYLRQMTEKQIENAILQYLEVMGWWCTKVQSGKLFVGGEHSGGKNRMVNLGGKPGTPDVLACIKGKFVAIEVKKDEKTARKWLKYDISKTPYDKGFDKRVSAQRMHRENILSNGGIHLITFSVEDLESDLRTLGLL